MDNYILNLVDELLRELLNKREYRVSQLLLKPREGINIIYLIENELGTSHEEAFKLHEQVFDHIRRMLLSSKRFNYDSYVTLRYILAAEINPCNRYCYDKFTEKLKEKAEYVSFFLVELLYLITFMKYDPNMIIRINQEVRKYRLSKHDIEVNNHLLSMNLKRFMADTIHPSKKVRKKFEIEEVASDIGRKMVVGTRHRLNKTINYFSKKMKVEVEYDDEKKKKILHMLENSDDVVAYRSKPYKIKYSIGEKDMTYTPDLLVVLKDKSGVLLNFKSHKEMGLYKNMCKWNGLDQFCSQRGISYLVTDGEKSKNYYKNYNKNEEYEHRIVDELKGRSILDWKSYKNIANRYNVDSKALLSIVLKNDIKYELNPFRLSIRTVT